MNDAGRTWAAQRSDASLETILTAAGELFSQHGPSKVSMAQVATAAGCSRATLYRHFENRLALQVAFAGREAYEIVRSATASAREIDDPTERACETVVQVLAEVRSRSTLDAWTTPDQQPYLLDLLSSAPWTSALVAPGADREVITWVLRSIMGILACPGPDADAERRLVRRFVAPLLT
ncbi:MAG: TetR/AcrR family transcriptional regulator [Nocardioides sp.]|uniref:TetR/AcrR family transcriptional regulator n=1 Tax=Nocardioides sp. TaxID=35761 RepID=UPI003EFBE833